VWQTARDPLERLPLGRGQVVLDEQIAVGVKVADLVFEPLALAG